MNDSREYLVIHYTYYPIEECFLRLVKRKPCPLTTRYYTFINYEREKLLHFVVDYLLTDKEFPIVMSNHMIKKLSLREGINLFERFTLNLNKNISNSYTSTVDNYDFT